MSSKHQRHNSRGATPAKIQIRRHVLAALTPERSHVFEANAGAGVMWAGVWQEAASYVGCDLTWYNDDRCVYVADNRRVLRAIDLDAFTVFDFDPFGSPWEQALILAGRRKVRPGERLGIVLTEGTSLKTRFAELPWAMREAAGLLKGTSGVGRAHDEIIARALHGVVARMGGRVVQQWYATGNTGAQMRYTSAVIERADGRSR